MTLSELRNTLVELVGADRVLFTRPDLVAYSADMWPRAQIWKLAKTAMRHPPDAIVRIESRERLVAVLKRCRALNVPVIPYGAGSGVCGGTLPIQGGVVLDLKGMNRVLALSPDDRTVTVEAGAIGYELERGLNEAGFTLGHFPSSLLCSTVGGYAAARSAGQYSSRYGTFEDLVLALTVALPDGRLVDLRRDDQGPDWLSVMIGNEGTLGVVVDATLRLAPLAETKVFRGFRLNDVAHGVDVMRRVMQAGLRPAVLRLYDPFDTIIAASEPHPEIEEPDATATPRKPESRVARFLRAELTPLRYDLERRALDVLLRRPAWLNRLADNVPLGCLLIAGFEGSDESITRDAPHAWGIIQSQGGEDRGAGPGEAWHQNRFSVSFKQSKVFLAGAFVDTMEVSTTWDNLVPLYDAVRRAVCRHAFIMAHFSHAYREGCSIYFTMAGRASNAREGERIHRRIWQEGLEAVVGAGGSISHHHGIGLSKSTFLPAEFGAGGGRLFWALKEVMDPAETMNPQKLWPRRSERMKTPSPTHNLVAAPSVTRSQTIWADASRTVPELTASISRDGYQLPLWSLDSTLTLGDHLALPAHLDWGPSLGGVRDNLLALEATLPGGEILRERPAPRRAAGPDLPGLLRGGGSGFGRIERALLRVVPKKLVGAPHTLSAGCPRTLLDVLRALFDQEALPLRATITVEQGAAALWLLPRADQVALTRTFGLAPLGAEIPWPVPGDGGFEGSPYLLWSALGEVLASACEDGQRMLVSRFDSHGAWPAAEGGTARARKRLLHHKVALRPPGHPLKKETGSLVALLQARGGDE